MMFNTSAGNIELIHPSQLPTLVSNQRCFQTVQQYTSPTASTVASPSTVPTAQVYNTHVKTIEHFVDKDDFILDSFVRDLYQRVIPCQQDDFASNMQDGAVECLQNFGIPTHGIMFGPNVLIVGEFDEDTITFKEIAPNYGALLIYKPNRFAVISLPGPCPYLKVEPKYGRYVSNILLGETFKRLGLV